MSLRALQRVVIFGATSAIAEQVARRLVSDGASVFCVARDSAKLEAMLADLRIRAGERRESSIAGASADLTDRSGHAELWEKAQAALGGVDAVLIAHGVLPDQGACEINTDALFDALDSNALSVLSLLTPIANSFQEAKAGVIAVIGSVAGDRGRQSNYVYGAAKGMVALFLQGLRNRLHPFGVAVVTIKPGFVITPMTDGFDRGSPLWAKPEKVADAIVRGMKKGADEVYAPRFWRWIMLLIKHLPEALFKRLKL